MRGKIDRILQKVTKITNLTMLFLFVDYNTVYRLTKCFSGGSRKMKIRRTKPRSVSIMVEYQTSRMLALIGLINYEPIRTALLLNQSQSFILESQLKTAFKSC